MNTVNHSSTELSISVSRLVRRYKLDICISDASLEEDKPSSEIGIATLSCPIGAESMMPRSVTDPRSVKEFLEETISSESSHTALPLVETMSKESESLSESDLVKDDGLEYYGPNVITALVPLRDLAWYVDKEFFEPICQYFRSWGKDLPASELCGLDIGLASRSKVGNPEFFWYCSLVYTVGLYPRPTTLQTAKSRSLLEACNVKANTACTASSKCDYLIIYHQKPDKEVEVQFRRQLVAWLGWDPEILPWASRPIKTIEPV
jgi:hypothetical protein